MFMPLMGFDPTIIAVAGVISTLWGIVGHTQIIRKLGPLEWIFNTPSHHRVHHGANEQYIDKNYGNLLIIWDRMFGTFEAEGEKVRYGLVKNVNTYNPSKITFMGWQEIYRNIKRAPNLNQAAHYLFGPPKTRSQ
jgi:sterol desaturase/sphingolipid hydroxylase (fatty acid hydroxylase superfamily)